MTTVTYRDGKWYDKKTGLESPTTNSFDFSRPWRGSVSGDYAAYECPVTGKIIEGRTAHEENLKRTGCRLLEAGEKEDNTRNHKRVLAAENKERDAAIDGIVDRVASEYFA